MGKKRQLKPRPWRYRLYDQLKYKRTRVMHLGTRLPQDAMGLLLEVGHTCIDATELTTAYWEGLDTDTFVPTNPQFGPLRLPYPCLWVEAELPSQATLNADDDHYGERIPMVIERSAIEIRTVQKCDALKTIGTTKVPAAVKTADRYLLANVFASYKNDCSLIGVLLIATRDDGTFIDDLYVGRAPSETRGLELLQASREFARPLLRAVALMNCKNVKQLDAPELAQYGPNPKPLPGKPSTVYRTIRLPDHAYRDRNSAPGEATKEARLHTVRGHFKTYTEDAPLMGKFTGTYWWAPAVRGAKKNGEVIKDYEVTTA